MIIVSAVVDPILISLVLLAVSIIVVGLVLRKLKQPYIIAYILAGLLLGSDGLAIVTDQSLITSLGSFGLIFCFFLLEWKYVYPHLLLIGGFQFLVL